MNDSLEILQKEYSRHCETVAAHIQTAVDDWKTATVGGLLMGWILAAKFFVGDKGFITDKLAASIPLQVLLTLGFAATVSLAGVLAVRSLFRLSIIYFLANVIKEYENRINAFAECNLLDTYDQWAQWRNTSHKYILALFVGCWALYIVSFPPITYAIMNFERWAYYVHFGICTFFLSIFIAVYYLILKPRFRATPTLQ